MTTSNSLSYTDQTSAIVPDLSGWDYFTLCKPRVMALVMFTTYVGAALAPGTLHPFLFLVSILSIALGAGASGVLNMWYDRDIDALMERTQNRPLPSGKIPAEDALILGVLLSIISVVTLGFAANYLAAVWLAFTILFYAVFYTMILKRFTSHNIVIGGAAGAFPPLIGWLSVSPEFSLAPLSLVLIIFLWTPPHFWALALCQQQDYKNASVPMLPNTHGITETTRQILLYTLATVISSYFPIALNIAGFVYLLTAISAGLAFLIFAILLWKNAIQTRAIALFKFSIVYLFLIFLALLIDHWIKL